MRNPEDAHDVDGTLENPTLTDLQDQIADLSAEMHERFSELRPLRRTGMAALWDGLFSIYGLFVVFWIIMGCIFIFA